MRFVPALVLAAHALAAPALAQDPGTRAGEAEQQRAERPSSSSRYVPGTLERASTYFEDRSSPSGFFNPPRGLFARFGGMPEGQGFTVGPAYRLSNYDVSFTTSAAISFKGAWEVASRLELPRPPTPCSCEKPRNVLVRRRRPITSCRRKTSTGSARTRSKSNKISYQMDEVIFDGTGGVAPVDWFTRVRQRRNTARSGRAPARVPVVPSIEALFDDGTAPAFRTDLDFVRVGGDAPHRLHQRLPGRAGRRSLSVLARQVSGPDRGPVLVRSLGRRPAAVHPDLHAVAADRAARARRRRRAGRRTTRAVLPAADAGRLALDSRLSACSGSATATRSCSRPSTASG